jgi:glycosyltransferase involved in cell wall biosynthesis
LKSSILYLTYDGLSDPLGQSQILPYLEGLAEKGYGITVISFEKGEIRNKKSEILHQKSQEPTANSQQLKSIQLKYHKSPPVLSTLYDLYLLQKAVKKVLKTQEVDIIHCRSYVTSLIGLWAKRRFGTRFIFDMRGFWADERVEGGLWNINNPIFKLIYQYFKRKEMEFLLESDATISLTQNAKQEIEQNIITKKLIHRSTVSPVNLPFRQAGIHVIPTCADQEHFHPGKISQERTTELRSKLGIQPTDFVLLYLGSLGTWYMLNEMLDFFEKLKSETGNQKKYKFLFVTKDQEVLKQSLKKRNLSGNEIVMSSCARQDVPKYISLCDVSIFFIIPTYSKKASAATKMAEVMAMGKPVITNTGWGDVDTIIPETGVGVLVQGYGHDAYAKAIEELIATRFELEYIRRQALNLFSLQKGIDQYDLVYSTIMKKT